MAYDTGTKSQTPLVSSGFEPTHPAVSPNGELLAFIALNRIIVNSHGAMGAINGPTPVHDVAWFPDSARMVYSAGPAGSSQIFATKSGGAFEQLTNDPGDHTEPAISPDGNWLAFTLARHGSRHIWLQNLASKRTAELTEGSCNSYSPAWEPDSRALVFASDCQRGIGLPALFLARPDSIPPITSLPIFRAMSTLRRASLCRNRTDCTGSPTQALFVSGESVGLPLLLASNRSCDRRATPAANG